MKNVGIIGAGHGLRVLAPVIDTLANARLVAMAARSDASLNAAREALSIKTFTTNWRDIVSDPDIDVVAVAVPPSGQPEIALAGLDAGKTLFLEKPLALHLADAEKIAASANQRGATPAVDFIFPMLNSWQTLHQMIEKDALGPIVDIQVDWRAMTYANRHLLESWKTRGDDGGGTLLNFAAHTFHYLDWLFGDIASIRCSLSKSDDDPRDGDTRVEADLIIGSNTSVHVNIDAGFDGDACHRMVVQGRDGTLVLENTTPDYVKGFALRGDGGLTEPVVDPEIEAFEGDGRILATARILGTLIDTGKPPAGLGVADALKTQRYLDAARVSSLTGNLCVVGLDF